VSVCREDTLRTHPGAFAALTAACFHVNDLGAGRNAFGIVAPGAMQRASLEKHRGADAGTILHRVLLDVGYDAAGHAK